MYRICLAASFSAGLLAACGNAEPKTQAELLLGEWEQTEPVTMTQGGQTMTLSDTEVEYNADGTTEGEVTIILGGVPEEMSTYRLKGESTYVLENGVLTETLTDGTVESVSGDEQARQMAMMIQSGMTMEPVSSSTIVTLTEDTLVLRENDSGTVITLSRD